MTVAVPVSELQELHVKDQKPHAAAAANAGSSNASRRDHVSDNDDDDEGDDNEDHMNHGGREAVNGDTTSKKKSKKKRKPKKKKAKLQTDPPTVLLSILFPNGSYPTGEEVEYRNDNLNRVTNEEKRHLDSLSTDFLTDYRHAAETHRQVRQWAQRNIKPGQSLTEIANGIEDSVRKLLGHDGLAEGDAIKAGMGFPTGLNLDDIAAHYSPNAGCKQALAQNNVMKVDIGVHVNGRIVDSAFTMAFDPMYDNLLTAVREATNTGVREAGIDVRLGELGGYIQETMESFEVEINGTTYPIKPIRNITGHNILPYSIHGTKAVPSVETNDTTKMEEGDVFAIETFGSTGNGRCVNSGECSHYALSGDASANYDDLRLLSAKSLLNVIKKNFGTLPWCRRYLDRLGQEKYLLGLNSLVKQGIVQDYPPLVDKKGSYIAQYEHTILLRPTVKEVISRGDDY